MIMKKVFNSLFVIIAAMVTFAGCQKEENNAPATPETKTIQFFANSIETKTQFGTPEDGTYPTLWSAGDEVTVLVNLDNVANTQKQTTVECSDDFKSANFKAELAKPEAESFTFYSVSPSSALKGKSAAKGYLYVEIPVEQDPLETSVDKKAQVLYAASATSATMPSSVDLDFHHLTAYGKFSLVNITDEVSSILKIKIEAPEDVFIAGKWDYFVANDSFVVREGNGSNAITLTTNKTSDIWFAAAPAATTGKTIKFTVTTDKGDLVKEVTFPGDLQAGKIARFAVNMDGINPPAPEVTTKYYKKVTETPSDWSGTYLIVYEATPAYWDGSLTPGTSSGQMGVATAMITTTISNSQIESSATVDKSVITISKSGTGYALKAASGSYMGQSGNNNGLKSATLATTYVHTITLESDKTVSILSSDSNTKVAYNKSSNFFRYYKVTTISGNRSGYPLPTLYRLEEGNSEPEQPKVLSSIAVSGQKTEYYVGEEFVAPTVTATYEGGATATVTATFTGYDLSEAGTHTVTVSYTENSVTKTATYEITVSEAPEIEELTVAEFLSAEKSDAVWYQLTGIITEIRDASWGNITIKDATESVYIYGLTKTKVSSNDKSFSSLRLKVGDQVTLVTVRGEYNGTAQGGGQTTPAYYVSHVSSCVAPTISCADNKVTITAEDGATIYYTTNGNDPTEASTKYTVSFDIYETVVVKAIAVATGKTPSSVAEKSCTYVDPNAGGSDEPVEVLYESFDTQNGTGGNDNDFAASGNTKITITGWTLSNVYNAKKCIKAGGSSALGSVETPALGQAGDMTLTFKAAAWNNSSEKTTLKLSVSGGGTLSHSTVTMSKTAWTEYTVTITGATASTKIKFEGQQASKGRFFLDEVRVVKN